MRVLLVIEQCNPDMASVPSLGYRLYRSLASRVQVTLCTHGRNEEALRKRHPSDDIVFLRESSFSSRYYRLLDPLLQRGSTNWPLYHTLLYPIYAEFNKGVWNHFQKSVSNGEFDIVHAFTPITPRYPVKIAQACERIPFFLGPVNGGIPFPKGFEDVARKEHAIYNPLKWLSRFLPGYKQTYELAQKIWVGTKYTMDELKKLFPQSNFELLSENSVEEEYFQIPRNEPKPNCQLLYVGRLEPVKCVDLLIEALALMKNKLPLSIVGDGTERPKLEKLVDQHNLREFITFEGWKTYDQLMQYYQNADVFCFPSIKDFGGAVVLEAMASGLPLVAVDYGGVSEYTDPSCGYLLPPTDPKRLAEGLAKGIEMLAADPQLRHKMGTAGRKRAMEYTWNSKAERIIASYEATLARSAN